MFFETANIKRGRASEKPPGKPIQPLRTAPVTTAQSQPASATVTAPRRINTAKTVTAHSQLASRNFARQNTYRPTLSPAAPQPYRSAAGKATLAPLPKKVSGWPSHKQNITMPAFPKTGLHLKPPLSYSYKKAAKPLQTLPAAGIYKKSGSRMYGPVGARYYKTPSTLAMPAGTQKPVKGWSLYRRGIASPVYTVSGPRRYYQVGNSSPDIQVADTYYQNAPATFADKTIPAARSWNYTTDTAIEPQPSYSTFAAQPAYKGSISRRQACRICGCTSSSCDTLSGFAVDSTQLNAVHKSQADVLAKKIITQKVRSVTATGHTDVNGTDDFNLKLGYKRAQNVIKEIMNRMHLIKPYSEQNVFWKIKTKGRLNSISADNTALNRRVEVCLR